MFVVLPNNPKIPPTADTCVAPPVMPVPVGALHVNVVPDGITPLLPSVGVILKNTPLHVVVLIVVTLAYGLILTLTVNVVPVQLPDIGVTVYVAVC